MFTYSRIGQIAVLAAALAVAGCQTRGPLTYAASPTTVDAPVQLDLLRLLDPSGQQQSLEAALAQFPRDPHRRDAVAGALYMASVRNCDLYMENLRGSQTVWRSGFSLSSLALGTAGSIVTDSASARLFSGLSGAAGSAAARLDEHLLGGMAADVMLSGVRAAREPFRRAIVSKIEDETSYDAWPIEMAIADIMQFHGHCNVISGLAAAQRVIESELSQSDDSPETGQGAENRQ